MSASRSEANRIKEELVEHCLETWRSKAKPMSIHEHISQTWEFNPDAKDENKPEEHMESSEMHFAFPPQDTPGMPEGALISDGNPKGYLFVPFDYKPLTDTKFMEERGRLGNITNDEKLCAEIDVLCDLTIEQFGLGEFHWGNEVPKSITVGEKVFPRTENPQSRFRLSI
jgi:hypothetical protein